MPPIPTIPGIKRVALRWAQGGGPMYSINVMHFRDAGVSSLTVAQAIQAHATAAMWGPVSTDYAIRSMTVTDLNASPEATIVIPLAVAANLTGQATGDEIPAAAAIIKLTTEIRGRSNRGRVYLGPVGEGVQGGGILASGVQASTDSAWHTFLSAMTIEGWPLVVASYHLAATHDVATLGCEQALGTIRRRQTRVRG